VIEMEGSGPTPRTLDEDSAWSLLRSLARRARAGSPLVRSTSFRVLENGGLEEAPASRSDLNVHPDREAAFETRAAIDANVREMLDIYLPLCVGERSSELVIGHLGQSLDGQIATLTGASRYVTGPENIRHLHRLRALFDAVLVGAHTVSSSPSRSMRWLSSMTGRSRPLPTSRAARSAIRTPASTRRC
jgi:hypothetical protein